MLTNTWMSFYNYHTMTPSYFDGKFTVTMIRKGLWELTELTDDRTTIVINRFNTKREAQRCANNFRGIDR
jgi:hypothetical protein